MPQRTIASGGGNWNSTSTWVEGAVPTSSDFVVGDATSGQLTLNVSAGIQYFNLSGYSNTITLSNTTLTVTSATTYNITSGVTWAGNGTLRFTSIATIVNSTTSRIPNLLFDATATYTLTGVLYATNYSTFTGPATQTINGSELNLNGNITLNIQNSNSFAGTSQVRMVGNGTISCNAGTFFVKKLIIDAAGFTITGANNHLRIGSGFSGEYIGGTLSNLDCYVGNFGSYTWNWTTAGKFRYFVLDSGAVTTTHTITGTLTSQYLLNIVSSASATPTFVGNTQFDEYNVYTNSITATSKINLSNGSTHNWGRITSARIAAFPHTIQTSSGTANINLTGDTLNSSISYINFTNINASGGNTIYTYGGVLTNTTNIVNTAPSTSGGVRAFAYIT